MNLDDKINEIEGRLIKQETLMESSNQKLEELSSVVKNIYDLTNSVNMMAKTQSNMVEEIKDMKKEINEIKSEPIKEYKDYKKTVIKDILGFIIPLILGILVSKFGLK